MDLLNPGIKPGSPALQVDSLPAELLGKPLHFLIVAILTAVSLVLLLQMVKCLVAQTVKHLSTMRETWVRSLGWEDSLENEMATHSSILAWKTTWTEEPGRLQSMGVTKSQTRLFEHKSTKENQVYRHNTVIYLVSCLSCPIECPQKGCLSGSSVPETEAGSHRCSGNIC